MSCTGKIPPAKLRAIGKEVFYILNVISRRLASLVGTVCLAAGLAPAALPDAHAGIDPAALPPVTQTAGALAAPGAPIRIAPADVEYPFGPDAPSAHEAVGLNVPPNFFNSFCSQGPVGTMQLADGTTQRIMLTAGHCAVGMETTDPEMAEELQVAYGDAVYAPTADGYQRVGTVVQARLFVEEEKHLSVDEIVKSVLSTDDWAIVSLDKDVAMDGAAASRDINGNNHSAPVAITGIRDYRELAPGAVAFDNLGQPICKDGDVGARRCGYQLFYTPNSVWHFSLNYDNGDSGGINFDPRTGQAIGVTSLGFGPLGSAQRADATLERAYGIPDGKVNDYFTPAAPAPRAEFTPLAEENAAMDQYLVEHNPDLDLNELNPPSAREQLDQSIQYAREDAAVIAQEAQNFAAGAVNDAVNGTPLNQIGASAGEFAGYVNNVAAGHAEAIAAAGIGAAIEEIGL